jgi:hypothetical protein
MTDTNQQKIETKKDARSVRQSLREQEQGFDRNWWRKYQKPQDFPCHQRHDKKKNLR